MPGEPGVATPTASSGPVDPALLQDDPLVFLGLPLATGLAGGLLRFAHHPHCDRHLHHLIWFGSQSLCLGCTAMAIGLPLGLGVALVVPWAQVPLAGWVALHTAALVPTVLQPLIQKKPYKIFARVLLGATTASYLISGLVLRSYFENAWLWRASVVAAFATGFTALYKWRQSRINDPCSNCPQGRFPTCDWNMPRLLAQNANDPLWIRIAEDAAARESRAMGRKRA